MTQKSLLILTGMASMMPITQVTADPIMLHLQVGYDDPLDLSNHRSPIEVPSVGIEEHTLYFYTPCDGCELRLVDSNGNVVFTSVIPTSCTLFDFPSDLEGEFEVQIISGIICFYADITL